MFETLCSSTFHLKMTHRCSIGFRSETRLASPLEVCLGLLSCWNTALRPSFRREGIMLSFSMSQYMLAFMVPPMNWSSPVLVALMQPQTMTLPPPWLTVCKTHLYLYSSPGCHHTMLRASEPNKFILVSSDHCTGFQQSMSF